MAPKVLKYTVCNEPNAKACSGCLSSAYCSTICQETDWKLHKILCKKYKPFLLTRPPSHKVAVLFPEDAIEPQLVWAEIRNEGTQNKELQEYIECKKFMAPDVFSCTDMDHNPLRRFDIDHCVSMVYIDSFVFDGVVNQSAGHTTGLGRSFYWKGPFLFWSKTSYKEEDKITRVFDFTLADLRLAVDRLRRQDQLSLGILTNIVAPEAYAAKGVMINCDGAMSAMNIPRYTPVSVPKDHPIFSSSSLIFLTAAMQLPLLTLRQKTDPSYSPLDNPPVTILRREYRFNKSSWGFTPPAWSGAVGNVLVVHRDKKNITPRQVERFAHFCQVWLEPKFQELRAAGEDVLPTQAKIEERGAAYLSVSDNYDAMKDLCSALYS